jgi:hypothetical protein
MRFDSLEVEKVEGNIAVREGLIKNALHHHGGPFRKFIIADFTCHALPGTTLARKGLVAFDVAVVTVLARKVEAIIGGMRGSLCMNIGYKCISH